MAVVLSVINLKHYRQISLPNIGPFRVYETFNHSLSETDPKSLLTEEGIFGIEFYATKDRIKIHLFSTEPGKSYEKPVLLSREKDDLKKVQTFYIAGSKASIFPFDLQENRALWDGLKEAVVTNIQDQKVFIQVLAQHQDISEKLNKDYELYLKGVQSPSSFYPVRLLQEKFIEWSEQHKFLSGNREIPDLQKKLSEDGYKVTIRMAIYGGNDNKKLVKNILSAFRGLNGSNLWNTFEVSVGKKQFIDGIQLRKFPLVGKNQYLCQSEILPLFDVKPDLQEEKTQIIEKHVDKPKVVSSKLPSLNHLPKGTRKDKEEDISAQQKEIQSAFKKVGIPCTGMKITKIQSGATIKKITMQIPGDAKFTQIKKQKENIQIELGWKGMDIEQGEEAGTMAITVPKEREKVFLRDLIDTEEFRSFAQKAALPFVIGEDVIGEPKMIDLAKMPHLIVTGSTGSGKSVFVVSLILSLLIYRTPYQLRMILIDPKMVEFPIFKEFPHVAKVVTDAQKAVITLKQLCVEMEKRYEKFARVGVKNIEQYNAKAADKLDYIVCVIDELADLMLIAKGDVEDSLMHLAQLARASGIHLIIATQRPSVDVLTGTIKNNFPSRIVMKLSSAADYKTALDKKPSFTLLGNGDGVASINGSDEYIRFQGPLVADGDEKTDQAIERICNEWNGVEVERELPEVDEEPEIEEEPVDDLTRLKLIIAETGETRNRQLQDQLGIRRERITELLRQLVEEGWLDKSVNKREGYKVIVSEEERNDYLNAT